VYAAAPAHGDKDFASDIYRDLFFDTTFDVKQYDYAKNGGVFRLDEDSDEFTIRNICMKLNANDPVEIPCFSYVFTYKPNKLPTLNIEALIREVSVYF